MEILISKVVVFAIIVESQQEGMLKVFDDDDVAFLLLKVASSKIVGCLLKMPEEVQETLMKM